MSFTNLKKSRKSNFSNLVDEIEKLHTTNKRNNGNGADERLWKLTVDKAGNGSAVIRFLPAPEGEDIPWIRIWDHGFQGPGGWYIENSLTTLGKKDPVSEHNSKLWNSGVESNKNIARKQKRRLSHYANIYVIDDKANPENNGKVFLFKFGKKIFDKVNDIMNPEFDDETAVNPFDLWEGTNFKLRARQLTGFRNYDKSEFSTPAPLLEDDGEMEKIWNQEYSLQEFLEPKNFKSYDELKVRMDKVLELNSPGNEDLPSDFDSPAPLRQSIDAHSMPTAEAEPEVEDESLSYFSKLADEA
jgi:hypothetical protein